MSYCKYYREEKQISYDNGQTWEDTGETKKGNLYQTDSPDCYEHQRWEVVPDGYICEDKIKYQKEIFETSLDGSNYDAVYPPVYRKGAVIEYNSTDCIYKWFGSYVRYTRPRVYIDPYKIVLCYNNNGTLIDDEINLRIPYSNTFRLLTGYIGDCVTSINASFSAITASSTTEITVAAIAPPVLESGADIDGDYPIYVPCVSVDAYKTAPGWKNYKDRITCSGTTPQFKYIVVNNDISNYSGECDSSSAITNAIFTDKDNAKLVIIGQCVTSIDNYAFRQCSGLTGVSISDTVTSIGNYAFQYCTGLTWVSIPNAITTIGEYAFEGCKSLTSINIPSGVTSISNWAFAYCKSLTSVNIPSGVTSIGYASFYQCSGLTSINIPDSVTSFDEYAFDSCSGLTSVNIPSGVTSIGKYAFCYCTNLTKITVDATTPPTLGTGAFNITNDCPIYVPGASLSAYKSASGWSNYANRIFSFESNIKWIATYSGGTTSSANCDSSTIIYEGDIERNNLTDVVIGECTEKIDSEVFYYCTSLSSVTMFYGITEIYSRAFEGCSGLTRIEIPSSVTYIGGNAFRNCSSLQSVTLYATTPPTIGDNVFYGTNNCPIYVPAASLSAYKSAPVWKNFPSRIQAIP